jgi:hypothetical protein
VAPTAPLHLEGNADPAEADPAEEPAQELVALADLGLEHRGDAPRDQPVIGRAFLDRNVRQGVDEPVKQPGVEALEQSRSRPILANGVNDVGPLFEFRDQYGDQLGRVLQVAIEHDDSVGVAVIHARDQRHLVTEPG